jgi:hypothetical protein
MVWQGIATPVKSGSGRFSNWRDSIRETVTDYILVQSPSMLCILAKKLLAIFSDSSSVAAAAISPF